MPRGHALGGNIPSPPQAAWYTLTPDSQSILGCAAGIEGRLIVGGISGHGFKLGPSVGEGLA